MGDGKCLTYGNKGRKSSFYKMDEGAETVTKLGSTPHKIINPLCTAGLEGNCKLLQDDQTIDFKLYGKNSPN